MHIKQNNEISNIFGDRLGKFQNFEIFLKSKFVIVILLETMSENKDQFGILVSNL